MKKLFSLLMLVSLMLFVSSCGDDDDGGNSNNTIVGNWTISEVTASLTSAQDSDSVTIPTSVCSEDFIFSFAANGDLTVTNIELDFDEAFEGNLDMACDVIGGELNGSWGLISGNTYNLTIDGETTPSEINFSNGNDTFELIIIFDHIDDPIDPIVITQTTIFKGSRN